MPELIATRSPRSATLFRIMFGLVWLIDATLKWLPGFRAGFAGMLDAAAKGQPGWLAPWFDVWTGLSHTQAVLLSYASAAMETFLAVALILGFARKITYLVGAGYSLVVWATAEGFGGPYQAGSTDIGTAIIYAFVFGGLFVLAAELGSDPYSLDYYIEARVDWWSRIAEVGRGRRPSAGVVPALVTATSDGQQIVPGRAGRIRGDGAG